MAWFCRLSKISQSSPAQGQAFFYFGRDDGGFRAAFGDCGLIVRLA